MNKYILFLLLFGAISLINGQQLEDAIYNTLDTFLANKNQNSLDSLSTKEQYFLKNVTSKNEHLALVILQCNKAFYLKENNRFTEAIKTYEKAWNRYSKFKLNNYDIIEYCLKPLGNLYTKTKNYTDAESIIKQYIFIADKQNNEQQVTAGIINLSKVYQSKGNHDLTVTIVKDALKKKIKDKVQKQKLEAIKTISLLALKQYEKASKLNKKNTSITYYKNEYQIALQQDSIKKAVHFFKQYSKLFLKQKNNSNRELAKFHVESAQLLLFANQQEDAILELKEALKILLPEHDSNELPVKEKVYAETTFIDIFDLLAVLEPSVENALKSYELSFYVENLLSLATSSQETRLLNKIADRKRSEKCIELCFTAYKKTNDIKYLQNAFNYAERSKGSILETEILKNNLLAKHPNDSLLLKEKQLAKELDRVSSLLINSQSKTDNYQEVISLNKAFNDFSIQLKNIKEQNVKKYPQLLQKQVSLEALQHKLKDDKAVLVEYFYGDRNLYQFVITTNAIKLYTIKQSDKFSNQISDFINYFDDASNINNNVQKYADDAYVMYESLGFKNIASHKRVIMIADGLLHFIPFDALLDDRATTLDFSKMPFLVKNQNIIYSNSSTLYVNARATKSDTNTIVGFFPVFKNTTDELLYSIAEADVLKQDPTSKIFMYDKATKQNFINNVSKYNSFHLSTHAIGGGFVTPATISFYDKKMSVDELYGLNLNTELAILSACETGVGKLLKGEGAISIARAFQYAGVREVLFSLWKINDKSTSIIMDSFYKEYNNSNAATANQYAKLAYLKSKNVDYTKKSPYYWSSFVCYGSFDTLPTDTKSSYIICAIVLVIILLLLFINRKRIRIIANKK